MAFLSLRLAGSLGKAKSSEAVDEEIDSPKVERKVQSFEKWCERTVMEEWAKPG